MNMTLLYGFYTKLLLIDLVCVIICSS